MDYLTAKFYYCNLYSIDENFNFKLSKSYSVRKSSKKVVAKLLVENVDGKHFKEVLTGKVYDSSYVYLYDRYSSLFKRFFVFYKGWRSKNPVHISFFKQNMLSIYKEYENYVDLDNLEFLKARDKYIDEVINSYGSIDNYLSFLNEADNDANAYYQKSRKKLF